MERPEYIMQTLRRRSGLEPDDTSLDGELKALSNEKVFDEVLTWEGLIHYGETILGWISDIFDVDLWDVPAEDLKEVCLSCKHSSSLPAGEPFDDGTVYDVDKLVCMKQKKVVEDGERCPFYK